MKPPRPKVGNLTVPFIVDERRNPVEFKTLHLGRVLQCATKRLCAVCGNGLGNGKPIAFVGPDDGRRCFADPWMHPDCAQLAMTQCPFLGRGRQWREQWARNDTTVGVGAYQGSMVVFVAPNGRVHRDERGAWHFEAVGELRRLQATAA